MTDGIRIAGVTPDYETLKKTKNVDDKTRLNIDLFKGWSKRNFYFEHNIVRYINDMPRLEEFPIELEEVPEYDKSKFDTAFSHLLYFAFLVGKKMQLEDTNNAIQKLCDDFGNQSTTNMIL